MPRTSTLDDPVTTLLRQINTRTKQKYLAEKKERALETLREKHGGRRVFSKPEIWQELSARTDLTHENLGITRNHHQAHLTGSLGPKPDDLDIPQKDPSDTPWLIEHQYLTRISFLHVEQWKEIRLAFKYHLESSAAKTRMHAVVMEHSSRTAEELERRVEVAFHQSADLPKGWPATQERYFWVLLQDTKVSEKYTNFWFQRRSCEGSLPEEIAQEHEIRKCISEYQVRYLLWDAFDSISRSVSHKTEDMVKTMWNHISFVTEGEHKFDKLHVEAFLAWVTTESMDDHRDRHLQWARDVKDLVPDLADDEYDEMCSQPDAIFNAQWEHHDRRWRRTEGLNRALEPRYALRMEANQDIAEKISAFDQLSKDTRPKKDFVHGRLYSHARRTEDICWISDVAHKSLERHIKLFKAGRTARTHSHSG